MALFEFSRRSMEETGSVLAGAVPQPPHPEQPPRQPSVLAAPDKAAVGCPQRRLIDRRQAAGMSDQLE